MRVCAVSLPELRIELVRSVMADSGSGSDSGSENGPLAVVVAPAPMTETKLLGNTRLSVVSREARAFGVAPGQTIAQARARAGDLAVRVVRPEAVRDVLARIAEVGLAFGATVSFSTGDREDGDFGDVVWIDITGCAHLHAPPVATSAGHSSSIFDNETILASRLAGVIASLGHTCSVAIADGPRVAAMLARATAESASRAMGSLLAASKNRNGAAGAGGGSRQSRNAHTLLLLEPTVVRPGDNAAALGPLPVSALPLPLLDVRWLAKIGVRTIRELRELPREGLGTRLGARARDVIALAFGEDRAPLAPYVPPEVPVEEAVLEYGIEGTQALTFVAKTLTDRLSARLQGRAVAAARVELELHLDAAMLRDVQVPHANDTNTTNNNDNNKNITLVGLDLPAPLSSASDLLAALRPKIERLVLAAPVLSAKLRAPVLVHKRAAALSLFEPEPKAERALPRLVAELVSDLGSEAVSKLVLGDSWVPEDRSKLVTFSLTKARTAAAAASCESDGAQSSKKKRRHMVSSVPEPSRLLAEPRHVSKENVRVTRHLSRLETIEWWKEIPTGEKGACSSQRHPVDYVQAWIDDGLAWVEIDRSSGAMRVRGWFD